MTLAHTRVKLAVASSMGLDPTARGNQLYLTLASLLPVVPFVFLLAAVGRVIKQTITMYRAVQAGPDTPPPSQYNYRSLCPSTSQVVPLRTWKMLKLSCPGNYCTGLTLVPFSAQLKPFLSLNLSYWALHSSSFQHNFQSSCA